MKPVILTTSQWKAIRASLKEEYPESVFLLRNRMRQKLGFTVREHNGWVENKDYKKELADWKQRQSQKTGKNDMFAHLDFEPEKGSMEFRIHLDFYSENKRTMFLLKFGELLNG